MSQPFVGEIRLFAGTFAPLDWAFCDGSVLAIAENEVLFNLIGTTYGGDGVQTFALPNLASRIPVHMGTLGADTYVIGQSGGVEEVTLSQAQLPAHGHTPQGSANAATATTPAGNVWASWADGQYSSAAPAAAMDPSGVASAGTGQPHDNTPPVLALSFIISLFGIFPSQD